MLYRLPRAWCMIESMKPTWLPARWQTLLGALFAFCAGAACAPSDPAPPLQFGQKGAATVVRVNNEGPEALMISLEVIPYPSEVLSGSDERIWRVVGSRDKAVNEVALGRTPPGWVDQVAWSPPSGESSLTVRVELTDGRVFLIDGVYR